MNGGAAVGFAQDTRERRALLRKVLQPELGFAERGDGVWTWTFKQNELRQAVEAPSGSAVHLAGIMGFPFIRLRAALPEELFEGSVAQSLGRREGMSVTGLVESREENVAIMTALRRGMSCFAGSPRPPREQIPAFFENDEKGSKGPLTAPRVLSLVHVSGSSRPTRAVLGSDTRRMSICDYDTTLSAADLEACTRPPDPHEMVGTALMFAFLANQHALPVLELSVRIAAAKEHFRGARAPGIDHEFDSLLPKFMAMLGAEGGALTVRAKWMATTRLWRFLLLQREEGCWDMTDSLAFALEAHEGQPPPKKPRKERKGLAALATLCLGDGELEDDLDDAADDVMGTDDEDEPAADDKQTEAHRELHHKRVKDCPISFSAAAMRHHIPAALLELNDAYADPALQRMLSRLTMRVVSGITLPDTPPAEHPQEAEAPEEREAADAAAMDSTHEGSATTAESSSEEPAEEPETGELTAEPAAEAETEAEAEPEAEAEAEAEAAAADPAAEPAGDATLEAASEEAVAEPVAAAFSSSPVWSGADGYGAHGTPYPAASFTKAVSAHRYATAGSAPNTAAIADAPRVPVDRIWATLLAIKVLEGMDVCWLVDDEPEEGEERTIVDTAREWLEAQGEADERVGALLESGELHRAADKTIAAWKAIMEHNIADVRRLDVLNRFTALTHLQRATGRIIKSIKTDHGAYARGCACLQLPCAHSCVRRCAETFATFLDTDGYIMRWQRFSARPLGLRRPCLLAHARCLHSAQ